MPLSRSQNWTFLKPGILICAVSLSALAQQPRSPQLPAPPPMRFVSTDERSRLIEARDAKARLRTSMDLATSRLTRTEEFTSLRQFDQASMELGCYLGLIDNVRGFIGGLNREKGSTRDLYRHLEIALRAHIPRIAVMRRSTPVDYAGNLKDAEEFLRNTRSEALDSFYGQSVLREPSPLEKKPAGPIDPERGKRP
jgi:hypothetical protein